MSDLRPGRTLLAIVGVVTSTGCFIADWNETHIYNPLWTPHAKFHNGQTMSMGALLGLCTFYYLYSASADVTVATVFASLYWITQFSAWFYPGSELVDPPHDASWNKNPQLFLQGGLLTMCAVGYILEKRREARLYRGKRD